MTTDEAMRIASKDGFLALYNAGVRDGINNYVDYTEKKLPDKVKLIAVLRKIACDYLREKNI